MKIRTEQSIKDIVGRTWFSVSDEDDHFAIDSREYGDICAEETGLKDREEGRRLVKLLREAGVKCSIEAVDEWVIITVQKEEA